MRSPKLILLAAVCALAAACTVERPIYVVSPETHTYRTKANAGLVGGGASAATKAATAKANDYCAQEGKRATITNVRVREMVPRFISEVTFQCTAAGS